MLVSDDDDNNDNDDGGADDFFGNDNACETIEQPFSSLRVSRTFEMEKKCWWTMIN